MTGYQRQEAARKKMIKNIKASGKECFAYHELKSEAELARYAEELRRTVRVQLITPLYIAKCQEIENRC